MALLADAQLAATKPIGAADYFPGGAGDASGKDPDSPTADSGLYSLNPGTVAASPIENIATTPAEASLAEAIDTDAAGVGAQGYDAAQADFGDEGLVDSDLNRIMSTDSRYMQGARQRGMLAAGQRGLENSSIAVGAAEGEAAKAALPMAQQNSAQRLQVALADQEATNRAQEFTAQSENIATIEGARNLQTANLASAEAANRVALANAEALTGVSLANADASNRVGMLLGQMQQETNLSNALSDNRMRELVVASNAELNRQFLAGDQAIDIARIEGQYKSLIASSDVASRMYESYFNSIAQAMAQKDISPSRIAEMIGMQQQMLSSGLEMMSAIYALDLDTGMPGIGATGNIGSASGQGQNDIPTDPTDPNSPYYDWTLNDVEG